MRKSGGAKPAGTTAFSGRFCSSGVSCARAGTTWKAGSCSGAPQPPTTSAASRSMRCVWMSPCSFQSASTCTRPCCMSTRLKRLATRKGSRLKSLFTEVPPGVLSSGVDNPRLQAEAEVFLDRRAQTGLALRFMDVVKCAHASLVVGAFADLRRARRAQLAVGRIAEAGGEELRPDERVFRGRLAVEARRQPRAVRDVREAHAALLPALRDHRRIGPGGEEDGVGGEAHDGGADNADDGAVHDAQRRAVEHGTDRKSVV